MSYTLMEQLRWWLPIISAFGIVIKAYTGAKKNVSDFCDKLLSNHLAHIEVATVSNAEEAKQTNVLLRDHSGKLELVQNTLADHQEKNLIVWQGVLESLTVLKERTRACTRTPSTPKRRKRNG
jgi:hypothetical protein